MLVALTLSLLVASDWPHYGNDSGANRYSPLTEITRDNVAKLKRAWVYRIGDMATDPAQPLSSFQCTPIMVDGTVYLSTPFSRVVALDAATGTLKWDFDPKIVRQRPIAGEPLVHRGVAAWKDGKSGKSTVFIATYDARLIALDADSGELVAGFGNSGTVDLKKGLRKLILTEYQCTAPPCIIDDLVVVGSAVGDNNEATASSGEIRAFDARTGKLVWSFDPAPKGGAGNAWAVITADPKMHRVYVPTSSQSPDYYGGLRLGNNDDSNAIVALDSRTGKKIWSFQVVHHDVWDYDIPSAPILADIKKDGKEIPSVVSCTKMGLVFVLDRRDGKPVFPIEERPVPASSIPGEQLSPTQPFPTLPKPLVPQTISPEDAWGINEQEKAAARAKLEAVDTGSIYTPISTRGFCQYPGTIGGMNWSGGSFDPKSSTLFVNTNNLPMAVRLIPRADFAQFRADNPKLSTNRMEGAPYGMTRSPMMTPKMLPVCPPPWGTVAAVDLASGEIKWQVPVGVMPQCKGLPGAESWGSLSLGGTIVTASGLIFFAGTMDSKMRAIDATNGKVLWEADLPAGGQATPMTYSFKGKQYVVICAGGHSGLGTPRGDYVVAYALP